jgi:hypothetical protein
MSPPAVRHIDVLSPLSPGPVASNLSSCHTAGRNSHTLNCSGGTFTAPLILWSKNICFFRFSTPTVVWKCLRLWAGDRYEPFGAILLVMLHVSTTTRSENTALRIRKIGTTTNGGKRSGSFPNCFAVCGADPGAVAHLDLHPYQPWILCKAAGVRSSHGSRTPLLALQ